MKRAAAAALALSVALSAAAPAALAKEYDISKGDITVTVTKDGDTYVRVGEAKDENDIGEKDDTEVVIKGGENPGKTAENNSDGPADEDTADKAEKQKPVVDAEPGEPAEKTGTELVVWPENVNSGEAQKKDDPEPVEEEQKTPDTQKPEGKTDAATLEASTEQKPVEKAAEDHEDDDDDKDIMTYEANTASTVTKAVSKVMNKFIKIINNCTEKDTTVTIENVNIRQYSYDGKAAMSVEGAGNTTLKLVGDNTLWGGDDSAGLEKDDEHSTGKLTITAEDTSSSLNAYGGHGGAGIGGGNQRSTLNLEIANGKIHAVGGLLGAGIGGGGFGGNGEVSISGGEVTAQGGNFAAGIGGGAQGSGKVTIKNGKVTAKTNGAAAAIGGGIGGSGDVTILDGTVTATKNYDSYPVTGIGGASGSTKKSTVRILGGVVDAVGYGYGSGIGGGKGGVEVEIGGGAQVTAKGGKGGAYDGNTYGAGAAIGTNGDKDGKAGKEQDVNAIGEGTVTRVDPNLPAEHKHEWTFVSSTLVADGQLDKKEYECPSCDSTRTVYKFAHPAPVEEEQNGRIVLRVIDALYEMHQESARYIVTADSDTATLFGCLGNLAELKAQGVDTLVFRTKSRETALDIDTMLSLGAEDTLFTLTHSGSSATLTVGGADHSELIH